MTDERRAQMFMDASKRVAALAMPEPVSDDERKNERGEVWSTGPWWSGTAALPQASSPRMQVARAYRRAAHKCAGIYPGEWGQGAGVSASAS